MRDIIKRLINNGISSDHDLIELAERIGVQLDGILLSSEIDKPPMRGSYLILLRPENMDVGHWTCIHNGRYFDSQGCGPPERYGEIPYNEIQYQGTYAEYCGLWCLLWLYTQQHDRTDLLKRFDNLSAIIVD